MRTSNFILFFERLDLYILNSETKLRPVPDFLFFFPLVRVLLLWVWVFLLLLFVRVMLFGLVDHLCIEKEVRIAVRISIVISSKVKLANQSDSYALRTIQLHSCSAFLTHSFAILYKFVIPGACFLLLESRQLFITHKHILCST